MSEPSVKIEGLRELRRVLRQTDAESARALQAGLKDAAGVVAADAAAHAPRRSGALAASIRPYAAGNKAGIRSRLPYAGVVHFGGTIKPRGVPITFKPRPFITDAIDRKSDAIVARVAVALDAAVRRAGWK